MATYAGPVHAGPSYAGPDAPVGEAIHPGVIEIPVTVFASVWTMRSDRAIFPGTIEIPVNAPDPATGALPGPIPVPRSIDHAPIRPGCIEIPVKLINPWVIPNGMANSPFVDELPRLFVSGPGGGYLDTASCDPVINDVGSGSYSYNHYGIGVGSPAIGDHVSFSAAGGPVFAGTVDNYVVVTQDENEEEGYITTVSVVGYADKLRKVIVYPMHGGLAGQGKPCAPVEESRVFDWTHVDKAIGGGGGTPQDPIKEAMKEGKGSKALPDPWPDPTAKWINLGAGWSYGSIELPWRSPIVQVWGVAYDYLEVYIDGVKIIECKNAGQPEFSTVTLWDERAETYGETHWMTYRCYTSPAGGVMMTVMPPGLAGTYGTPVVNTGKGGFTFKKGENSRAWSCSDVLARLAAEAGSRGAGPERTPSLSSSSNIDNDGHAITLQVGMTYLDVLNQLGESLIDWRCLYGGTVECWPKGRPQGTETGAGIIITHSEIDVSLRN